MSELTHEIIVRRIAAFMGNIGDSHIGLRQELLCLFKAEFYQLLDYALIEIGLVYLLKIAFAEVETVGDSADIPLLLGVLAHFPLS